MKARRTDGAIHKGKGFRTNGPNVARE